LTEFDSMVQLHLVHYTIHPSCHLCTIWFTEPSSHLLGSCVTARGSYNFILFTDLPLLGFHTLVGLSSPFQTLLDFHSPLYKLLTFYSNSILQQLIEFTLFFLQELITKSQPFTLILCLFLASQSFNLILLVLGNSLCTSPINLTALA
jgi:hypothetical protein